MEQFGGGGGGEEGVVSNIFIRVNKITLDHKMEQFGGGGGWGGGGIQHFHKG